MTHVWEGPARNSYFLVDDAGVVHRLMEMRGLGGAIVGQDTLTDAQRNLLGLWGLEAHDTKIVSTGNRVMTLLRVWRAPNITPGVPDLCLVLEDSILEWQNEIQLMNRGDP